MFFRAVAPVEPIGTPAVVSPAPVITCSRPGSMSPRPGSHTLRHTLRAAARRRRLRAEDDRRFRRAPLRASQPRSTRRSRSSRCVRSRSAMARRCSHDHRQHRMAGRPVPRAQACARPQVRQRGARAAAAGPRSPPSTGRSAGSAHPGVLDEFLGSRPRSRPRAASTICSVSSAACSTGRSASSCSTVSPLQARRRRVTANRIPFLFDSGAGPAAAGRRRRACRTTRARRTAGATYRTIFALCYGLGLRAGEACGLRIGDVDTHPRRCSSSRAGSSARAASFRTDRGSRALLDEQLERRAEDGATRGEEPLFTFDGTRAVHPVHRQPDVPPARRSRSSCRCRTESPHQRCTACVTASRSGACCAGIARGWTRLPGCISSRRSWGTSTRPRLRSI